MAGAGLLAGDHVTQRLRIQTDAALHLASAGAMLTYGTPGGGQSMFEWSIEAGPGAKAFLVSEPYVLLDDADLKLRQVMTVAADATVIGCEGIVCARPGNRSRWETETLVQRPDGTHLFIDRQTANPDALSRQYDLAGAWTAFGTLMVLRPGSERHLDKVEHDICARVRKSAEGVWIGTSPMRAGIGRCIRIAAKDGQKLRSAMMQLASRLVESSMDAQVDAANVD